MTAARQDYLESHRGILNPSAVLGGPIRVRARQTTGDVRIVLPGSRGPYEQVFDAWALPNGRFALEAIDATATDAATTNDSVQFEASWQDPQGNTYAARCHRVVPCGAECPVFGGVVTNHILDDFNRVGAPSMPAGFTYVAFWGTGEVLQNGRVVDGPVLMHGALMEMVRFEGYRPAPDGRIMAMQRQFHLQVPAVLMASDDGSPAPHHVRTGFFLPDGQELPFWHIVFENPEIGAARLPPVRRTQLTDERWGAPRSGFTSARSGASSPVVVGMTNALRYRPSEVTITVGQTVEWRNTSNVVHTVTADPALASNRDDVQLPPGAQPFHSGNMMPGAVFRYTFQVPGTYRYFCIPHEYAGMVGTVHVEGQSP